MNTNPDALRVLFYGDSITYGHIGRGPNQIQRRYPVEVQRILGNRYEIIAAGLGGRAMTGPNPYGLYRDGLEGFGIRYGEEMPLHLVSIMLGTNDANDRLQRPPEVIAEALHGYFDVIEYWAGKTAITPEVLIMAPPRITTDSLAPDETMYLYGEDITRALPSPYQAVAKARGAHFFDAGSVTSTKWSDGVHLDEAGHIALAAALAPRVRFIVEKQPVGRL